MAKQDQDPRRKPKQNASTSEKRPLDYTKAKLVSTAPTGPEWRLEEKDGKKYYVREKEKPKTPGEPKPGTPVLPPNRIPKPKQGTGNLNKPKPTPPKPGVPKPGSYEQEIVYLEDGTKTTPEKVAANLDVAGRIEYKVDPSFQNEKLIQVLYPEAGTGGYASQKTAYADRLTGIVQPQSVMDEWAKTQKYVPVTEGRKYWEAPESAVSLAPGQEVNKDQVSTMLSNTKNPVARVNTTQEFGKEAVLGTNIPDKADQGIGVGLMDVKTLPSTELKDKSQSPYSKEFQKEPGRVVPPKFKKGGTIKGYFGGGNVSLTEDEKKAGVIVRNGKKYDASGKEMAMSDLDAATAADKQNQGASLKQTAGSALGGYGSGYYAANATDANGNVSGRSTALGAVSNMGAIGGVIGGVAAIGDQIGEPIKQQNEEIDPATGKLKNKEAAKTSAIVGGLASPSKAWETRTSYEGGMTDISGEGYVKHLEQEAQKQNAQKNFANEMNARQQQFAAQGGTIKGKGGPKDDAIYAKVNDRKGIAGGSFIVPAENNGLAKKIRERVLGGNPEKKAQFKKEGGETEDEADVAVSNGEHLFTPSEKKKIIAKLGEEILEELAPNAEENNEEKEMNTGGLIKRADGSYSRRGLWDNIRENKGSGKKPTSEMLKQEEKIKNEYAKGGYVVEKSSDRKGKTHKVTGPDGTVKYFGDSNLGQHPDDPERKKAFYARHKENLNNNPYFRAFARETWAEGGTVGSSLIKNKNGGELSANKAKQMLHDKSAQGHPLTDKQRKFFGWVAGGRKAEGGDIKAPMMYAKGTPPSGVKRQNSTGVSSADKMIDDIYANPPKTQKELEDKISKIKALTRSGDAPKNAEVSKFLSWANPMVEKFKTESDSAYKANVSLTEKGPDIIKNIQKLKDMGASDKVIKQYTEEAKAPNTGTSTVKYSPNDLFKKYKEKVEDEDFAANRNNVKKELDNAVQVAYKKYRAIKDNPEKYTPEQIKKAQSTFDEVAAYRNKANAAIDKNDINYYKDAKSMLAKMKGQSAVKTGADLEKIKQAPADKLGEDKVATKGAETETKAATTDKTQGPITTAPKVGGKGTAKKETVKMADMGTVSPIQTSSAELVTPKGTVTEEQIKTPISSETLAKMQPGANAGQQPPPAEKKWWQGLGNAVEYGAAAAQIGIGLKGLSESGKRPVGEIDPLFAANVNKAQAAAQYGFTPEQQLAIDQQNQNALNAARFAARNYSTGNAGTAYVQERAAINEGWGRGLQAKIAGLDYQQQKQQYADELALRKADMSRQLFKDKLTGWEQEQQAGANLLGAGIRNVIGASRYQKELEAAKQRQNLYNA